MEAKCQLCGQEYEAKRSNARFCLGCRNKRQREQVRQNEQDAKQPCLNCGQPTSRRRNYCFACFRLTLFQRPCNICKEVFEALGPYSRLCPNCKLRLSKEQAIARNLRTKGPCAQCGEPRDRNAVLCYRCSNQEKAKRLHENAVGRRLDKDGYIYVRVLYGRPGKGKGGFYRGEHILNWERANNKPLPRGWVVHHLNAVKSDNRVANLAAMPRQYHHSHPREALRVYERRILALEKELLDVQQARLGIN